MRRHYAAAPVLPRSAPTGPTGRRRAIGAGDRWLGLSVGGRRGKVRRWLARHPRANVANSRFLAKVPTLVLPAEPAAPAQVARLIDRVTWVSLPGTRYDVGVREPGGSLRWLAQDVVSGEYPLARIGPESRVFVRAVNAAGFSPWVRAGG